MSTLGTTGGNLEVQKRFKSQILMANISYGSNNKTKHMLPSSFWKFLVHTIKELEVLLICSTTGGNLEVQKRFKSQILMANISYGSNNKTKHMLPSSFWKFLVHTIKELEVLLICSKSLLC
ncbi:60S ribosomal protein L32 [Tupaia chinensis]|uniref:60S ribosomal protein L32 n=1 Tax=Tupaia chinensis TaxID=246437 RepID=L9JC82_TUPCH|nr:60S ribosomal protein L32 [Tupaia chinensis]